MIIQQKEGPILEGESTGLCCHSNSNPHAHYIAWINNNHEVYSWRRNATANLNGTNIDFCLPTPISFRNQSGNFTCVGENNVDKSNISVAINVLCKLLFTHEHVEDTKMYIIKHRNKGTKK